MKPAPLFLLALFIAGTAYVRADGLARETPPPWPGDRWRAEHRLIDLHQHITATEEYIRRAVGVLDRVGIGLGINLSGGTVTRTNAEPSEFERARSLFDRLAPNRFL